MVRIPSLEGKEKLRTEPLPMLEEAFKLNEPLSIASFSRKELRNLWSYSDFTQ